MPESEINILDAVSSLDARPEDTSYNFKTEEKEVNKRINTLFGKEGFEDLEKAKEKGFH